MSPFPRPALRRASVLAVSAFLLWTGHASAQGYFIPPQAAAPRTAAPAPAAPRPAPRPAAPVQQALPPPPPVQIPGGLAGVTGTDTVDAGENGAAQLPNLPVPDLPALPKGASPPAPVIGVLGVPEIMRATTAAQQVEKVIAERREKLNQDAQKEQAAWRDLQQQLGAQRATLECRSGSREGAGTAGAHHWRAERLPRPQPHHPGDGAVLVGPDRADADRRDPSGGGKPRHEPGAAPGAGRAERVTSSTSPTR